MNNELRWFLQAGGKTDSLDPRLCFRDTSREFDEPTFPGKEPAPAPSVLGAGGAPLMPDLTDIVFIKSVIICGFRNVQDYKYIYYSFLNR